MLKVDISGLMHLAHETGIPFWEFEVACGIRPTIQYPDLSLDELKEYNLRAVFQLGKDEESHYAVQLKFISTLQTLATEAQTDEDILAVIKALPTYYIPAGDTIWEKKRLREDPDRLSRHKKLMQVEFAKRDAELSCCETSEEIFRLATRHLFGEYPRYDTHTDRAFLALIESTNDVVMLQEVRERSLVWHQSHMACVRKIAALTNYVNRGL